MSRTPYDEWQAEGQARDEAYQAGGDIPPGHPDAYDEELAEWEYCHRYALADVPCPLNVPERVADDDDLDEAA